MKTLKHLFVKTFIGNEITENQFEVVEEICSDVISYDKNGEVLDGCYYQEDCGISSNRHYENGLLMWEQSDCHRTDYTYDDNGNLISYITVGDHGVDRFNVSCDDDGCKIENFDSAIEENCYTKYYDKNNNLVEHHCYEGHEWYNYDDAGNLIEKIVDDEHIVYSYDEIGRLIKVKKVENTYDEEYNNALLLELEEYEYEGDSSRIVQERRYTCEVDSVDAFLKDDCFNKKLIETRNTCFEVRTIGDKIIKITQHLINDIIDSKTITITDKDDTILKYYSVTDCQTKPIVVEKTCEYWD